MLYKILLMILLYIITYAFTQNDDVEISEPLSVFMSTATQKIKDRKMVLKVFEHERDIEQTEKDIYNLAFRIASVIGSPDPKLIANLIQGTVKYYLPFTNYDLEIDAAIYAIGHALEDKDLLPDVNTAVKKANELIENLQVRIDELSTDHSGQDIMFALIEGADLFFKENGGVKPTEYVLAYKRFYEHVFINLSK